MPSPETTQPWPRERLDRHVTQRLREHVDIALAYYDDHGCAVAYLREGGEQAVWETIQKAISDAGWRLCK